MRNTHPDAMRSFLRPSLSDITPIGKLNKIPARGETAAISPRYASFAPRDSANKGSTGFFAIVVENIAKQPIMQK
jgi:hypothetical protein